MRYKIGLDIGIASVGWATIELNENDEPARIIELNSRIFDAAEHPKDGSSLALPRRTARGARRRLRRHRHRIERIKNLIVSSAIITQKELEKLYDGKIDDIYKIRVEALDKKLNNEDFARLLIHLAQRRGFKSNRKSEAKDKDAGKLLKAVEENRALLSQGYRTVGEMLYNDEKFKDHKRNKSEDYSGTIGRALIEEEIKLIFEAQRKYGSTSANEDIEKKYLDILLSQRPFDLGPGEPSPYGGDQIEKMIGKCTFEEGKRRAAKATYSFEYFTLLQNVNNTRISSPQSARMLTEQERTDIIALAHKTPDLTYEKIRKLLNLDVNEIFGALSYGKKTIEEVEKTKFNYLKAYHEIRKTLDKVKKDKIKELSKEQLNIIGSALTIYKSDDKIKKALEAAELESDCADALLELSFSKFGHLSVEACDKISGHLKKGLRYDEACEKAGYKFKAHESERGLLLNARAEALDDITNPVVRRAISQTIKVVNGIIRKYGSPCMINVELAREMSKAKKERDEMTKHMQDNQAKNERLMTELKEEHHLINPKGEDLVKYKLWKEQDGICPYSQKSLQIERLFGVGYCDVDHIIPYSVCFDDGYKNKVVVFAEENRQKGNRLPMQYLTGKRRDEFAVWVENNIKDTVKKQRLLKEKLTEEEEKRFKERNLNDTKYISRFIYNFINDTLIFAEMPEGKRRVFTVNGAVTAYMRKRWGISKIREDGDLHHAVDAVVAACISQGMIQRVSNYANYKEMRYMKGEKAETSIDAATGEVYEFPAPWKGFRKELDARLSNEPKEVISKLKLPNYAFVDLNEIKPAFVSRMPKRKASGAAHKDTIKSPKMLNQGYVICKKALTELKLNNEGEIEGYYQPQDDRKLYEMLKNRLSACGGDAKKAFGGDIKVYKPTAEGNTAPLVKKVKITEKSTLNVAVRKGKGAADNDSMIRIDIFYVENDGYYFVPIYLADTIKEKLPNKACIQGKSYEEWKEMNDKDFIFSLYPNDLIKVTHKNEIKMSLVNKDSSLPKEKTVTEHMFYYVKAGIAVALITVINHDKTYKVDNLGIKTLKLLEKYQIDVLGQYHKVDRETRLGFKEKSEEHGVPECADN